MWISKKEYENIMARLSVLERDACEASKNNEFQVRKHIALEAYTGSKHESLQGELSRLRERIRLLVDSLGLVYRSTPSKEEYVKKGGPERG